MAVRQLVPLLLLTALAGADGSSECTCGQGTASYLWLRCPRAAPADPDPCPSVRGGIHRGGRRPGEWNDFCLRSPRMECFLRRHGAAWRIRCSLCATARCCPFPNWKNCPECGGEAREPVSDNSPFLAFVEAQRRIGGRGIEGAMSAHFIALTDVRSFRIVTGSGGRRLAGKHEMMHLFLQRAEMARRDFEEAFGSAYDKRSVLVLASREKVRAKFAQAYFGQKSTCLRRGYNSTRTVAQGWAINGWCTVADSDDDLNFRMRHMVGHLLMSTYLRASPMEKYLPKWIDAGVAHWLSKLHPRASNTYATYCMQESKGGTMSRVGGSAESSARFLGTGKRWKEKARKIALLGPRRDPVEAMFTASTERDLDCKWHIRAWSWFDTFLREDREKFVRLVRLIRRGKEPRAATKAVWGQPPEVLDERWRRQVLGRRRLGRVAANKTEKDPTTVSEVSAIRRETDMRILASRIRGLERCETRALAKVLLNLVDKRDSDRVHEVVAQVLARSRGDAVVAYLRGEGYARSKRMGRAILCRVFGEQRDAPAAPVLRAALKDEFWLVRANAARALARIGDLESIPALTEMAAAANIGKLRIAAMDALAGFGSAAAGSIPRFERNIMNRAWQVKVATCQALARIGDRSALEILIGRIDLEGGRVHDEIRLALKALTGQDRDWTAERWRKWWAREKRFENLERRSREELGLDEKKDEPGKDRYAKRRKPPTYYDIKIFARTVGYVLDISASMKQGFEISRARQQRMGRLYSGRTRIGVSKEEIAFSIRELDPRTRLNLYFFNDRARAWQTTPVAAGAMRENAIGAVGSVVPDGATNYYDAFRLVLGEREGWRSAFADTPDTMLFLTDGLPTDGEITKADELLAWFVERNRFARLKVHVIGLGRAGLDPEFLRGLAEGTGGRFLHLSGSN